VCMYVSVCLYMKKVSYEILHRASELAGPCETGNEILKSSKDGEFID